MCACVFERRPCGKHWWRWRWRRRRAAQISYSDRDDLLWSWVHRQWPQINPLWEPPDSGTLHYPDVRHIRAFCPLFTTLSFLPKIRNHTLRSLLFLSDRFTKNLYNQNSDLRSSLWRQQSWWWRTFSQTVQILSLWLGRW